VPELPEVETIRRQLAPHLEGRTIREVEILDPRWTRPDAPAPVQESLRGAVVERIGRSGKYLVWSLSGDRHLLVHLRMTGSLLFDPPVDPIHTRVRFELDAGHRLVYVDPRRFGTGHLLHGAGAHDAYLAARIGVEPLTPGFTTDYLRRAARGRKAPIKAFVLDQRRIAGVGNIYADEALFRAGIHPLRPAGRLTGPQWAQLRDAIEEALEAGIEAKGASIDDFRHVDGARGSFQDRFLVHLRAGEPCLRCGTAVRKIVVGGRGTYVCERCQPKPRARRVTRPAGADASTSRAPGGRHAVSQAASSSLRRPARSAASS
jgi:formamidopyrimidine-DNA glycosylase